jgi:hypothetical protein
MAFSNIPAEKFTYLPFPAIPLLSLAITTYVWLLFNHDADWDAHAARKNLDFAGLTLALAQRAEESEMVGISQDLVRKRKFWSPELSMSLRYRDKLRAIRALYLSKVAPTAPDPALSTNVPEAGPDPFEQMDVVPADGLDSAFWEALMNEDVRLGPISAAFGF